MQGIPVEIQLPLALPQTSQWPAAMLHCCAKDPAPAAVGLVAVKFERLSVLRRLDIEINVIAEVGGAIGCAKLLPPQGIGIGVAAGYGEDSGYTAHGGR